MGGGDLIYFNAISMQFALFMPVVDSCCNATTFVSVCHRMSRSLQTLADMGKVRFTRNRFVNALV